MKSTSGLEDFRSSDASGMTTLLSKSSMSFESSSQIINLRRKLAEVIRVGASRKKIFPSATYEGDLSRLDARSSKLSVFLDCRNC